MVLGFDLGASRKAAKQLRTAGDKARDRSDWDEAAEQYRQYLKIENDDFAIWVQLGHALKEQKKYDLAESAYERARDLKPDDADIHLQLGHLLKLTGRNSEAVEAYGKSYAIEPTFAAEMEMKSLGGVDEDIFLNAVSSQFKSKDVVYIELDDMLIYLEAHSTVSGIQRVQAEFARFVVDKGGLVSGTQFVFVINPPYQDCVWKLQPELVHDVVKYATGTKVDHEYLKRLIASVRSSAVRIEPSAGQCYLVLGAFWVFNTVSGRFLHLKRLGLRIGGYIHDLIPINQPEYCDEGLCHEFLLSFGDSMQVFDFILTNSHHTANEVIAYRKRLGLEPMPVEAVQLAHANKVTHDGADVWTPKIKGLKGKKFAMMVSTIEARKNHKYLVDAWRQFYNEGLEPPELVFVGRFGWRVHDLMNTLKQSRNFDGKLHILHGLTDGELNKLYKECSFTVFPSYVEGWGLPVGEGLAHGKPCVSSLTSAMPEIGGDFVDYVDPWNLREGIEVFRKMCFDEEYREARRLNIEKNFVIRTWSNFAENLAETTIRHHGAKINERVSQANFQPGIVFRPNELSFGKKLPTDYAVNPVRLLLSASWGAVEHWGSWMLGDRGEIEFKSPYKAGDEVVVYLEFFGAPFVGEDGYLTVVVGEGKMEMPVAGTHKYMKIPGDKSFVVKTSGKVGENGIVNVNVFVDGEVRLETDQPGARRFSVGIKAVAYSLKQDAISRSDIAEELVSGIVQV
ncbi:glycosyltransferase [Paraburkholderia tropica]|uniref:glycosyltransferase family 4 protein n=1 Tax=Paraburkholderia tropica TaxID=92647 RepID=UPI003D2E7251